MPDKKAERPEGQMRRRPMRRRKKVCAFCADANKVLIYIKTTSRSRETCYGFFCAGSDERRHGKFPVVLARTENFPCLFEERRDNARTKFWHMSCPQQRAVQSRICLHKAYL